MAPPVAFSHAILSRPAETWFAKRRLPHELPKRPTDCTRSPGERELAGFVHDASVCFQYFQCPLANLASSTPRDCHIPQWKGRCSSASDALAMRRESSVRGARQLKTGIQALLRQTLLRRAAVCCS